MSKSWPVESSIDSFVDQQLSKQQLTAAPPAPAAVLLRRMYYDLIGLPPPSAAVARFAADCRGDRASAIATAADRLLTDPRFGEHWAASWLDVVRYSETKGHVTDQERPYAWKYRDYVIDAFNDDVPYDRFVLEHLAGDLLPESEWRSGRNRERNVTPTATGWLFLHEMHFMAVDPVKQRWDEINAQIEVTGKAFLGLTLDCARCHDHKFDAISQQDYYALAGFFYSTEQGRKRVGPREPVPRGQQNQLAELEASYVKFLKNKQHQRQAAQTPKVGSDAYFPISDELGVQSPADTRRLLSLMDQLTKLDPSWSRWVRAAKDVTGKDVPLLIRGSHRHQGDLVHRRFLAAISGPEPPAVNVLGTGSGRYWLARQIASPENPLTARVWANRIWQQLFGKGIVATPNNFGVLGRQPSHPVLLDYLATRLINNGWSTKELIREIITSRTYQRATNTAATDTEKPQSMFGNDPENVWLARQNVRRLTAEQLRDTLLAVSGRLDSTMHGPSTDCFVPSYATANKPGNVPQSGPLDGDGRRSIYLKVRRNFFDPFLLAFDFPDRGRSIGRRSVTNVPNQALAMMNSPLIHQLARHWGERLAANDSSFVEQIRGMWLTALSRDPTPAELAAIRGLADQLKPLLATDAELFKELAHVVFNHPELMWIR